MVPVLDPPMRLVTAHHTLNTELFGAMCEVIGLRTWEERAGALGVTAKCLYNARTNDAVGSRLIAQTIALFRRHAEELRYAGYAVSQDALFPVVEEVA